MLKKIFLAFVVLATLAVLGSGFLWLSTPAPKRLCEVVESWGQRGHLSEQLYHPMGLAALDEYVFVADTENGAVKKFRANGTFVDSWARFKRPVAVAVSGSTVYVADFLTDRISRLDVDGTSLNEWGKYGTGPGEFDAPAGITVDQEGYVYVSDFYNHRIQKFTTDGRFVLQWGENGRWNGQFHYPTGLAAAPGGRIYVADAYNHRIQVFDSEGKYLAKWGGIGYGISGGWPGWFRLAKAVATGPGHRIYVADAFNYRAQVFTPRGEYLGQWGTDADGDPIIRYPAGLTQASRTIYLSDFFQSRIWKVHCP